MNRITREIDSALNFTFDLTFEFIQLRSLSDFREHLLDLFFGFARVSFFVLFALVSASGSQNHLGACVIIFP